MTGSPPPPPLAEPDPERGVEWARARAWIDERIRGRNDLPAVTTSIALASTLVLIDLALLILGGGPTTSQALICLALLVVYVVAYRIQFEADAGSMVPTEPVLVALLLSVPLGLVPLTVLAGVLIGSIGSGEEGGPYGWSVRALPAWHSLGPVAVLLSLGHRATFDDWPILLAALVAQFAIDALIAGVRMTSLGVPVRTLVRPLLWTFGMDALMGVIGAALVIASADRPAAVTIGLITVPVVLIGVLSRDRSEQVQTAMSLGAAYEHVHEAANTDSLTGMGNRRRWEAAIDLASRQLTADPSRHVAVMIADLDGLKAANDTHGHEVGDQLIVAFARVLTRCSPAEAVTARLGGDEFGMIIVGDEPIGLAALLATLRRQIDDHPPVGPARLAASLGGAQCPPAPSIAQAVHEADEAAAEDKRRRRVGRDSA